MSDKKTLFLTALIPVALSITGCTTVKYYPANFVESLKHPTKFPEVYAVTVKNIEEIADKNPLEEDEEIKITSVGENKNSSMHLIQVRKNGELYPHYHKRHDEVIYVKKGSGIATLDGSRYLIKPGSILQIPSKTVHKFLNTGDELFVAVSIFSPPFDGRDEKKIKRKKKADRGAKTEKRIVAKKPERVVEEDKISSVNEPNEEEIQPAKVTSENLAENNLHKPVHEEWDMDSDKSVPPLQHPVSEEKKRSQDATLAEEPIVNIKDLHEKLTQLLKLKEEGTLSEEEYEEKKDAIVKGKDIGELPQLKGSARNQIPL
ncbi:MAG: cupin domain-containing protein, partial [Candidatus Jettenia caeni]|nr:cupin domain-containing protein [Candidatus Jettenia caeni]